MLEAYTRAPDAFTSTAEERAAEPASWWVRRIADPAGIGVAFGAFVDHELVGTVALEFSSKPKTKHRAQLIGMYVTPGARALGIGRQLVEAAIGFARARPGTRFITLTVTQGNEAAIKLYRAAGFSDFGIEPLAILTPGGYKAKIHMGLELQDVGAADQSFARPQRQRPAAAVSLRQAMPQDTLCLCVLATQVFLDTYATAGIRPQLAREVLASYSEAVFAKAIEGDKEHITLAEHEGHLVGFCHLRLFAVHEFAPPGVQAELFRLYVQEPFTGARIGTRLLEHAEQQAADEGASVLWLTPWTYNHRAMAFYSAHGYKDCGLSVFSFEGESHENRVYARTLTSPA